MVRIVFSDVEGEDRVLDGKPGHSVMETAKAAGIPGILGDCGGACACATCHVHVAAEWMDAVGPRGELEETMLEVAEDVRVNSRLSCQIRITEALDGLVLTAPDK